MKKLIPLLLAGLLSTALFCGCVKPVDKEPEGENPEVQQPEEVPEPDFLSTLSDDVKANLSADGYVKGNITDFSIYENTSAYRKVTTADELVLAISDAVWHYDTVWNEEEQTYTQSPSEGYTEENFKGTVHVIEIMNDLNLGYDLLSQEALDTGLIEDFCKKEKSDGGAVSLFTMSDVFLDNGISQIKAENISDLLIYSKNGARLTHGGFKLTADNNVVFRNLEFDEMWQWEDASEENASKVVAGDYDAFGWAYFKISFSGYIWIDHCTFGKSYDGQIDYANPVYNTAQTCRYAPYGADGNNGIHISWCNFTGGSDDPDGYLYQMMDGIEKEYQAGGTNYAYYNALRKSGVSFEDILYGLAIPQKKGFLCGDKYSSTSIDYAYSLSLQVSFANCIFTNLEDRQPKVRGGNAVTYNCIFDASQYYTYRTVLRGRSAASIVQQVNSNWKCALTSQGIVCGNGASVYSENCIYKGIESLLKNNDTNNSGDYAKGGYCLVNCRYQVGTTDYTGSSSDSNNKFKNASASTLTTDFFSWHTSDGEQPFSVTVFGLDALETTLKNSDYGAGVNDKLQDLLLKSEY